MKLTDRQEQIIQIVKKDEPISGDKIAKSLGLTKSTLRTDLGVLSMTGILEAKPKVGYIYSGAQITDFFRNQLFTIPIKNVMKPPVIIDYKQKVKDAVTNMFMHDVGTIFVTDSTQALSGVVSRKDLLRSLAVGDSSETPVAVVMSRMPNIWTVTEDMSLYQGIRLLVSHQIESVPVVEQENTKKIIGKFSKSTVLNAIIEMSEE